MCRATGVEPTNDTDLMSRWVSSPSTATLSPLSTLNIPSGRPASAHDRAIHNAAKGTFSLGFNTTVLPAAIAREEPHRHHRREIERADDRHWTQRLTDAGDIHPGRGILREPALEQVRDTAGELHHLLATGNLTPRIRQHLAVLGVINAANSPAPALSNSRNRNSTCERRASEVSHHAGNAALAVATAESTSA
jgi:hypothetical protein